MIFRFLFIRVVELMVILGFMFYDGCFSVCLGVIVFRLVGLF